MNGYDHFTIFSTLGHVVLGIFNFYAATKFAVTALSQGGYLKSIETIQFMKMNIFVGFRKEMLQRNSHIKISVGFN